MKKKSRPGHHQPVGRLRQASTAGHQPWSGLNRFAERFWFVILLGISLVAFGLRAFDLRADPPPDLSWSSAIYSDEAHNAYSARNWALYGRWQIDDYIPYVVYPWLNIVTGIIFKLFGIGFVQLKVVSLLAGLLLVFIIFFFVRAAGSALSGLVAALLTACCFPLVMYSRLGLAELSQVMFLAAAGLFLVHAERNRLAAFLSGVIALGAVLFVKVSSIFCPAAIGTLYLVELIRHRRDKGRFRPILSSGLFWLLGALLPLTIWLLLIFLPHRADYLSYVLRHSLGAKAGHPSGLFAYLLNAFSVGAGSRLLSRIPIMASLGFAALPALWRTGQRRALAYLSYLLLFGVAMLGYQLYHPDRYELFTILPLLVAFALVISRLVNGQARICHPWPGPWGIAAYSLWLWPLMTHIALHSRGFWGLVQARTESALLLSALFAAAAASTLLYGLHSLTHGGIRLSQPGLRGALALLLLALTLGNDLSRYNNWLQSRTNNMFNYSRELDTLLPQNSVAAGFWAPAMLATSHKRALFISEGWHVNLDNPVGRFGVTHLVVSDEAEFRLLDSITSGRAAQARIVRRFPVRDRQIVILELP
ncbi:MAG: glycosyltransferase family 39 protein [candidate division WOR-3 bacterium]